MWGATVPGKIGVRPIRGGVVPIERRIVRLSSKGQLTLPLEVRKKLGMEKGDRLLVEVIGEEVRIRREVGAPIADDDPMWELIGKFSSGLTDVSENHDKYLAEAEIERWKKS